MTTYDTNQTSTNVEHLSNAKERIKSELGTRRPWNQMLDFSSIAIPQSVPEAISRIKANFSYFRTNYVIIMLLILFLTLLLHPISLIAFGMMIAAWFFFYFLRDEPNSAVMVVLVAVTIVLLLLSSVRRNVFSSVLIGMAVVAIHGGFRETDDLSN